MKKCSQVTLKLLCLPLGLASLFTSSVEASIDEDFNKGALNFVEIYGGDWFVSDSYYHLDNANAALASAGLLSNISVHQDILPNDYQASAFVQLVNTGSSYDDAAFVFDYQDTQNYCFLSFAENNKSTVHGVFKVVNGSASEVVDFSGLSITPGIDYLVQVIRSGTSVEVYVNYTLEATMTAIFSGGQVGFGSQNDPAMFNDLIVSYGAELSETFDASPVDFTVLNGGTWNVTNGEYILTSPGSTGAAQGLLANISVNNSVMQSDYAVSGSIRTLSTGSNFNDGALVFGLQDVNNYYYVSLCETDKATTNGVFKVVNGVQTVLQDFYGSSFASNVDYAVSIVRSGNSIVVEIDDVEVASLTDATFSGGQVGFGSQNDPCFFDDLVVGGGISGPPIGVYYADPVNGSMSNPGTSAAPWSSLEDVLNAGYVFFAGEVILLRDGYHGAPVVTGHPSGQVLIMEDDGHAATLKQISFEDASNWTLSGVEISGEFVNDYDVNIFVNIDAVSSFITVEDCEIYSTQDTSAWSRQDWKDNTGAGFSCAGEDCLIDGNNIYNVSVGINLLRTALRSEARNNIIQYFRTDGMRGLGNFQIFDGNTVMDCINADPVGVDGNHEDGFQSWSVGPGGVGTGVIEGLILRNNVFVNFTDPNEPFLGSMQGIGMFDGYFESCLIENNIVCVDHYHGISIYGGRNCTIINNTVVENPDNFMAGDPWLNFFKHKNGTPGYGNIIRNNLAHNLGSQNDGGVIIMENNIEFGSDYTTHFVDYANFDFHIKSTSAAVDGGTTTGAPVIDFEGNPRDSFPDIGADEL